MDFVQCRHDCAYDAEFTVESCQHSRISHHTHRQITLFDSDDFLPGEISQGSKNSLGQPKTEATLPKLLAETMRRVSSEESVSSLFVD